MLFRILSIFLLALISTGCSVFHTTRIYEQRTTALVATSPRLLILDEPIKWSSFVGGGHYEIRLPQGAYHVEARDNDYLYYQAPEPVYLGKKKFFSEQDSDSLDGGIFVSRRPGTKYKSGAYVDFRHRSRLLLFFFDWRFRWQEGKQWHYLDDSSPHIEEP